MHRSYLSLSAEQVRQATPNALYGELASRLPFAVEPAQRTAWQYQITHLEALASALPEAHFFLEFLIPRMGRRADLVIVLRGLIFVVEYKVGATTIDRTAQNQALGYALDLKYFHETSHKRAIVPIVIAPGAVDTMPTRITWTEDRVAEVIGISAAALAPLINKICAEHSAPPLDPLLWVAGRYMPTPTIVEAAQALYRGHQVEEISRSEAGAQNLSRTADYISSAIELAKQQKRKVICFVTGVPGSGKTLAGLNIATARQRAHQDEHAIFLSGNGPLVEVLREALALDAISLAKAHGKSTSRAEQSRRASAFIQNIHHFRDDALTTASAPTERVAIFDEAQRAWDAEQTSKFMLKKKGLSDFSLSEPAFLLSVMDRHEDWCAIICLVGDGQEINTGEAGIAEWLKALAHDFPHWQVHLPHRFPLNQTDQPIVRTDALHLATSLRSFRAEKLADFVAAVLSNDIAKARSLQMQLTNYPLVVTRDLQIARNWLRKQRRGNERIGLLASSNALRLKPHGVFVKCNIEPCKWFLADWDDVRGSNALEDAATEFDVQGLELDWACLCWDINLRPGTGGWQATQFKGSRWQSVNDPSRKTYVVNAYRVLLTRARQGLVVFVPHGDHIDFTRPPDAYDAVFNLLLECGFNELPLDGAKP